MQEPNGNEAEEADVGTVLMALAHQQRPHYGVQFHPESVATTYGRQLLLNFKALAAGMSLPSSFIPLTGLTAMSQNYSHFQAVHN